MEGVLNAQIFWHLDTLVKFKPRASSIPFHFAQSFTLDYCHCYFLVLFLVPVFSHLFLEIRFYSSTLTILKELS